MKNITTIDQYIKLLPKDVQAILQKIRQAIHKAAPNATEDIRYQLPTFRLNNTNLVHFGGWKEHIGFYATPSGNKAFQKEIAKYENAKGSIKFPLSKPIPYGLITRMVKFRVKEVMNKGLK